MDILIPLLIIVAFMHFIYEGIIAPRLRDKLNHQMFELRDQLRAIQIKKGERCPQAAFDIAHDGINHYVNRIHWLTVSFIYEFDKMHENPEIRAETSKRRDIVENCDQPEIKRIVKEANGVLAGAFVVNSAPFFAFFLVLHAIQSVARYGFSKARRFLDGKASDVFASPSSALPLKSPTTLVV